MVGKGSIGRPLIQDILAVQICLDGFKNRQHQVGWEEGSTDVGTA